MRTIKMRRYWLVVHLYLGLLMGGFFVLLGLTGSVLVFYNNIDRAINPAIQVEASHAKALPLQHVLDTLRQHYPDRPEGWRIELPASENQPIMARYMHPIKKQGKHFAPLMVTLDPVSHRISSSRFWGDFVVTWIYDLHYTLLLEEVGKTVLAIMGLLIMVSLLSGIYLWWPRHGGFAKALAVRKQAHFIRKVYDWHKISGLISFVFLLMLAVTGVMLEKPKWFESTLAQPAPLFQAPALQSQLGQPALTLDQIKQVAEQRFPQAQVRWIYTPDSPTAVHQLRLYQATEPSQRFPKTSLWIDQYTGKILAERDARQDVVGDVVLQWLHPLHNGEALGLIGRWLIFFSGFVPLILFVTGLMRWQHKRKAQQRK